MESIGNFDENGFELILSPSMQGIVNRSLFYLKAGCPVHFSGPTGVGKTTIALHLARQLKKPYILIQGHHQLSDTDFIGGYLGYKSKKLVDNYIHSVLKEEEETSITWSHGKLAEAVKHGYTVVYDEFNRSSPEVNNIFLSVLEERRLPFYGLKHKSSHLPVHPDFSVIFTSNYNEYVGVFKTQDALMDRLITVELEQWDEETEGLIIAYKTGIKDYEAYFLAKLLTNIRGICSDKKFQPSVRACIMIGKIAKSLDIPIHPKDKKFKQICIDVLSFNLARSEKVTKRKAKKLILAQIEVLGDCYE